MATAGVDDILARMDRSGRDEHPDDVVERIIGDGQQKQVCGLGDGRGLGDRNAREHRLDPGAGRIGLTTDGDDLMASATKSRGQDGANSAAR